MEKNDDLREEKDLAISDISEVQERINNVYECMELTRNALFDELKKDSVVDAFKDIKFGKIATDPLDNKVHINFIEFLNQSFSDIVVLKGVEYLLNRYKGKTFYINPGPLNGFDIESDTVIAECFSVVSAFNNQKIKSDSDKLMNKGKDKDKYIFFYSHNVEEDDRLNEFIPDYPEIKYMRLNGDLNKFEEILV